MAEIHGTLVSLAVQVQGDSLSAAASSGATTLSLYDVSDFDESGGWLSLDGNAYIYDAVDMTAETIHLTSGLLAAGVVNDVVAVWDPDYLVITSEMTALVTVDDQGDGDPLSVDVDHSLSTLLAQDTLSAGQSVTITEDGDGYRLVAVHGKRNVGTQRTNSGGMTYGLDNGDGTVTGLQVPNAGSHVKVSTIDDVRIKTADSSTYMPILASAFTVSSDSKVKTKPTKPPDGLAIIKAAPAKHGRYLTDAPDVLRLWPRADDLPAWMTTVITADHPDEEDHLGVDAMRLIGVLWRANEQLLARIEKLEEG